jgi:hypothetical protein
MALGSGPVRAVIDNEVTRKGRAVLGETDFRRWPQALKVIWVSRPSYQGPLVIRGTRLDKRGPLDFGEAPNRGPLIVPAGPSGNDYGRYRSWPNGAWMKHPGCYGWQVDGLTFSETIIVEAVLP